MRFWTLCCLCALLFAPTHAVAKALNIGMTTALSGPAANLGQSVKQGVEALFQHVNRQGGIHGHTLRLVALDDGYEPRRAAPNMRKLINDEKVLAVIGNVGTPTAIVTVPIAQQHKTLLFGAFTGAGILRKSPPDRYIINYRASYAEETANMIDGLLHAGIKPTEIAFFTQSDGYGDSGYQGAIKALKKQGFTNANTLAHGRYARNSLHVEGALSTILEHATDPRAIIMVGAYKPCAEFIRQARRELPDVLFLNVSFVGSMALLNDLGREAAEGVIVTQVVPHHLDDDPGLKRYRQHLKALNANLTPGFTSLEGYIAAKIFVEGLKKAGDNPTRESLVNGLESLSKHPLNMAGIHVTYSPENHQASHRIWPTVIHNGTFQPLSWNTFKVK